MRGKSKGVRELTGREERFCLFITQGLSPPEAALRAGYAEKSAASASYQIKSRPLIKARLLELRNQAAERVVDVLAASESEVLKDIRWARDQAKAGSPILDKSGGVMRDAEGELIRRADLPSVLKASELMGRTLAMFTDKQRVESEMAGMSDEELYAFFIGALDSNEALRERVCRLESVQRTMNGLQQEAAAGGEGGARDSAEEAESVSPPPEAGSIPPRRVH